MGLLAAKERKEHKVKGGFEIGTTATFPHLSL
jgi:hypothetical protein